VITEEGDLLETSRFAGRPYVLISTDCHAGADLPDYKSYLTKRWHEEFDSWAATFTDTWADIDPTSELPAGCSSFMHPVNWDSRKRLQMLEEQGIVAEVLFPNTVPPFFPNGLLAAPGPRNREEYERRWAGLKAHNRWLRDFCDEAPGRRFGVAQLFIDDVDEAVEEVRWAKAAGLREVLLPGDHHLKLHNLYYASLEPLWAACEELDMPIGRHGAVVGSDEEPESIDAAHACGVFETSYFGERTLFQLILSGVFERHPNLKFVFTETSSGAGTLEWLDAFYRGAQTPGTIWAMFGAKAVAKLPMLPSEYYRRNVYASLLSPPSHADGLIDVIDPAHALWGADFPHHEGTAPYTRQVLRATMSSLPEDQIRPFTSSNAAVLYGADVDFLQGLADQVGPTVAEVATPLRPEEIPDDPATSLAMHAMMTGA
jgi:predicted TIM-barrel fold metal-dependent hydrolase